MVLPLMPSMMKRPYKLFFQLTGLFVLFLVAGATLLFTLNVRDRLQAQQELMNERTATRARDKAQVVDRWQAELVRGMRSLAQAELVRLYVMEGNAHSGVVTPELAAHSGYLSRALYELKDRGGLRAAMLLGLTANVAVAASDTVPSFNPQSLWAHNRAVQGRAVTLGSPIAAGGRTYLEIFIPLDDLNSQQPSAIGTLYLQADVTDTLNALSLGEGAHERTYLLYRAADVNTWHVLEPGKLRATEFQPKATGVTGGFNGRRVFRNEYPLRGSPYLVVHETSYDWGMYDFDRYEKLYFWLLVVQVVAAAMLFMGLLWFGLSRRDKHRVRHLSQMAEALIKAIEVRDPYLGGHHERFAKLALEVGAELRLNKTDRATLFYAAKLSGIGRIFIPKKIINKKGKLTAEERAVVEQHVEQTMQVLDQVDFELPIKRVIRQMHERADGSGYPNKLTIGDIDLRSQILGVCDVFCAMTRPRLYRDALPADEVLSRLANSRDKFSPLVVDALIKVYKRSLEKAL
jgi:hypothetical protein